eukprot:m.142688 g.142688  ORF g.142688 m.142688 type:complete len:644 (+) comp22938_c0_seq1:2-1933(+)
MEPVCLALAHSLHVSGFKVKCEAVDLQGTPSVSSSELSQRDSVHHTSGPHGSLGPESGSLPSRQDESVNSATLSSTQRVVAVITQAPPSHQDLVGMALVQLGAVCLHNRTAPDLQAAIITANRSLPPLLAVFTAVTTSVQIPGGVPLPECARGVSQHGNPCSTQGDAAPRKGSRRAGIWVPECLVVCTDTIALSRSKGKGKGKGKASPPLVQWVWLPPGQPGGPFLHDYIRRCDNQAHQPVLPRSLTAMGDHQPIDLDWTTFGLDSGHSRREAHPRRASPDTTPTPFGLLFHCSRCGSTLVANALRFWTSSSPQSAVVSEPGALNDLLIRRLTRWTLGNDAETADASIATVLSSLGARWAANSTVESAPPSPCVIKASSWNIFGIDVLLDACRGHPIAAAPDSMGSDIDDSGSDGHCPWVFIYRDPIEVAVSELASEGGWLKLGRHQPNVVSKLITRVRWPGVPANGSSNATAVEAGGGEAMPKSSEDSDHLVHLPLDSDVVILSEVVGAYFDVALQALAAVPNGWVLNYSDIVDNPEEALASVHRVLIGLDPPTALDPAVLGRYSKAASATASSAATTPSTGAREHTHIDDRARKWKAGSQVPGLTEAIDVRCSKSYARLQGHDRRLLRPHPPEPLGRNPRD